MPRFKEDAEWRRLYELLKQATHGEIFTYDRLSQILGRDIRDNRGPIIRAMKELEELDHHTLVNVRGVGYRIAEATEHETLARAHSNRSSRQLDKAVSRLQSADRSQLTPEASRRLDSMQMVLRQHGDMLARLATRSEEQREELQMLRRTTTGDIANVHGQVSKLVEALQRQGISISLDDTTQEHV